MLAWHEEIDRLSRDTKTTSAPRVAVSRDPVAAAIANVGLESPTEGAALASSVAAVPGDRALEGDAAEQARAHNDENKEAATATFGETAIIPENETVVMGAPGESVAGFRHEHRNVESESHRDGESHRDADEDSEEGGGSSEEEYATDDELARTRTAPTTPAAGGLVDHNPLEHDHIHAEESGPQTMKAETLPAYVGNGVSAPEKAALTGDHKAHSAPPPILGEPVGTSTADSTTAGESTTQSTSA